MSDSYTYLTRDERLDYETAESLLESQIAYISSVGHSIMTVVVNGREYEIAVDWRDGS